MSQKFSQYLQIVTMDFKVGNRVKAAKDLRYPETSANQVIPRGTPGRITVIDNKRTYKYYVEWAETDTTGGANWVKDDSGLVSA